MMIRELVIQLEKGVSLKGLGSMFVGIFYIFVIFEIIWLIILNNSCFKYS